MTQENTLKHEKKLTKNETYINILQSIYSQATARIYLKKLVSDEFSINREVRQGDPLSPKQFTAVMGEVFKKLDTSERMYVDGENFTNLRLAYDIALFNGGRGVGGTKQNKWKTVKQPEFRKSSSSSSAFPAC